jgi:hypothetical protein
VDRLNLWYTSGYGDGVYFGEKWITVRPGPTELTTFTVEAEVREFKLEDDSDIHVVINTPGNPEESMIVELVDVSCTGASGSPQAPAMVQARQDFVALCGQPSSSSFKTCAATVEVTGVGFFDFLKRPDWSSSQRH